MAIQYILRPNNLVDDPAAFRAVVLSKGSADLEEVITRIIDRSTTVGEADIRGVLADFFSVVESMVLEGRNVITPIVVFRTGIKGIFVGEEDGYDPARHQVVARVSAGRRFRRTVRERARVVKAEGVEADPKPTALIDVATGSRNDVITPEDLGRLIGRRLKFDQEDPTQGVFFISLADTSETRVTSVGENLPGKLIFGLPPLTPGEYELEVRSLANGTEELRKGKLKATLTVV